MIKYKEWSGKGKGKPAKSVDWDDCHIQPPTKDSKEPEKPKKQPQVKEWLQKKRKENIDWGSKSPRDIQLTNKVLKPEKQPQVKEFNILVTTDGFASVNELQAYLGYILKSAVGGKGVKNVEIKE